MSRYTGPAFKKARRYGYSFLESGKEFAKGKKRTYAPGQHGKKKVKLSDYGLHLYEKQKIKNIFGMNEKQLLKFFERSTKIKGIVGTNFLQLLESRLDNLVYRSGLANTRRQARQLVTHGHFTLNGHKANIPSMIISINDKITLKEGSRKNVQIVENMKDRKPANWLTVKDFVISFDRLPERNEIHPEIKENLVVEYYSK